LIEEYERYEIGNIHVERKHPMFNCNRLNGFYNANIAIWDRLEESEETEVKNIEELKSWFEDDKLYVGEYVKHKINQLDEPEVLSSDWIKDNQLMWTNIHGAEYYV